MMVSRTYRHLVFVLLVVFGLGWLPSAPHAAAAPPEISEPPPTHQTLPPETQPVEPALPMLSIEVQIAPNPVIVGQTAVVTLTVANAAPDGADAVEVRLPTPEGALALAGPGLVSPSQGWHWSIGRLEGYSETIVTATLQLERMPRGAALLLAPQVQASGLGQPILGHGGTLASPSDRGPARITFTPGAAAELRSRDGRLALRLPAQAAQRRLTIAYTQLSDKLPDLSAAGASIPPALAGTKPGFGTFFLDATDDTGAVVDHFDAPLTLTLAYTPEQLQALGISETALTFFSFDQQQQRWLSVPTTIDLAT